MGVSVSKDQYKQACSVDLYEFLIQNHPSAVEVEYGCALLLADKHVSVICVFRYFRYHVKLLLFTLAGNSLTEVDSFLILLAIVRWNQILLFIRFI